MTFKLHTDDMRESPATVILDRLISDTRVRRLASRRLREGGARSRAIAVA